MSRIKKKPFDKLRARLQNLPSSPGIYLFKNKKGQVIYVGKSANLRARVRSYFAEGTKFYNSAKAKMVALITDVKIVETSSEIEALVKEAELIKKLKPKFNVLLRDSKNYVYVVVTKEDFPRIRTAHQINKAPSFIGPFTDAKALKKTLRFLRPIFPYYIKKSVPTKLARQIGVAPAEDITKTEYKKNISAIKKILTGKSKVVERQLKKDIKTLAKKHDFEQAKTLKEKLDNLQEVMAHAHVLGSEILGVPIFSDTKPNFKALGLKKDPQRIETYDISNIGGQEAVGSMVVFGPNKKGGYAPKKSEYRKFKIKTVKGISDTAMMREVIERRLKNKWPLPELMVIDGGKGQLNAALKALAGKKIPVIALAKRLEEVYFPNKKDPVLAERLGQETKHLLQAMRDETHRFAITFHRKLHRKAVIK